MNKRTEGFFEDVTSLIWNELAVTELGSKACSRLSGKLGKQILKACKEAGLKFVPDGVIGYFLLTDSVRMYPKDVEEIELEV